MRIAFTLIFLLVCVCSVLAEGIPANGAGTAADPYQITTLDNLLWLGTTDSVWSCHFIQTANIDASATQNWNGGAGWSPVGEHDFPEFQRTFSGEYDGQGYTISSLFINRPDDYTQGFFGCAYGATLQHIHLASVNIVSDGHAGCLAGLVYATDVLDCSVQGTVSGCVYVGGCIGSIQDSSSVTNCTSDISVSGDAYLGGFVARLENSDVEDCHSAGTVIASFRSCGGFAYDIDGSIVTNSSSAVDVHSADGAGGFVYGCSYPSSIDRCWSSGDVFADEGNAGGFACTISDGTETATACYSYGDVHGTDHVSGFVAFPSFGITDCFYPYQSVMTNGGHCLSYYGLPDSLFQDWIDSGLNLQPEDYFPVQDGAYCLSTPADIYELLLFANDPENRFILMEDIDLANNPALYIPVFHGELNGNGHAVRNMLLGNTSATYCGFIGFGCDPRIQDLAVEDASVNCKNYLGILIGYARDVHGNGIISGCSVSGTVSGYEYVGGLVGSSYVPIVECTSDATVSGQTVVGGLVGSSIVEINGCSCSGEVMGSTDIGGLAGGAVGTIANSHTTCDVTCTYSGGGFVGNLMNASIHSCTASGSIGSNVTDVLIGGFCKTMMNSDISYSQCTGNVTGYGVSGFVDQTGGECTLSNCHVSCTITGQGHSYGFSRLIGGLVEDCTVEGNVVGHYSSSGFVGKGWGGSCINRCSFSGELTGDEAVAGFVHESNGLIMNSSVSCTATGHSAVGFARGVSGGRIRNCSTNCDLIAENSVSGFAGILSMGSILDCYAIGSLFTDGSSSAGFISNSSLGTEVANSFCAMQHFGEHDSRAGFIFEDIIFENGDVSSCFWDTDVSNCYTSSAGTGKTTAEMQDVATYTSLSSSGLDLPWDFAGDPFDDTGANDFWDIDPDTNNGYPYFATDYIGVTDEHETIPEPSEILAISCYPNPFNPSTTIRYSVPQDGDVTIAAYNIRGQKIATLLREHQVAGWHDLSWNAHEQASGIYLLRLDAAGKTRATKIMLLK